MPLRWQQTGGAGPSPQNTVANCVPGEKDEAIMREVFEAGIKLFLGGRKNRRSDPGQVAKLRRAGIR
jgi:hypothetical protein